MISEAVAFWVSLIMSCRVASAAFWAMVATVRRWTIRRAMRSFSALENDEAKIISDGGEVGLYSHQCLPNLQSSG